jgi:hypothetical protein
LSFLWLGLLGVAIGTFGTIIGAGGGFILLPVLLILYPDEPPEVVTGISLAVSFCNALSGTIAYARQKRINYRVAILFTLTSVPGAILGANLIGLFSRALFQMVFGVILLASAIFLIVKPEAKNQQKTDVISFNLPLGLALSFAIGVVSGLFGIGGGIMHVPMMTQILSFPVHMATATSHFVVTISTISADASRIVDGTLAPFAGLIISLSLGAVIGAQIGAILSRKFSSKLITRLLAGGLALMSIRLFL